LSKAGQPTKYRPEYCEALIAHMKTGLSYTTFCNHCNCCVDTLYEWEKQHPEFSEAKKRAFAAGQEFWELAGINGIFAEDKGPKLNASAWIFNMKNRFKWTDRQDVTTDGDKIENNLKVYLPEEEE